MFCHDPGVVGSNHAPVELGVRSPFVKLEQNISLYVSECNTRMEHNINCFVIQMFLDKISFKIIRICE